MLDMTKGQALDLSKEAGKAVTKVRVGAGWDVAAGKTVDLDLWLVPNGGNPLYFNNKSIPGATLDGDDTTGAGSSDGADENVHIDVAALANEEYTVIVNIYDAVKKGQFFRDVQRAFVEVEDTETGAKILNFNISENGGDNFSLVAGTLKKVNGGLEFTAKGDFSATEIQDLVAQVGGNI